VRIIVTVNDEGYKDVQAVANELTARGMTVERVLPLGGAITGSAPDEKVADLKTVPGVKHVQEEQRRHTQSIHPAANEPSGKPPFEFQKD
jgi:hypothetical protein